ncbi:MAG TPA: hypothetical protein VNZ63_14680 [Verrucomicrobiae bacterium]|jgi:hypothetical protein|nr:hypothetical protein [Verrucomicrobiae bacterium]
MPLPFDWRVRLAQPRSLNISLRRGRRRNTSSTLLVASLMLGAVCASCSVAGSGPAAAPSVTVQPNSAQVFLGGKMHFQAAVQNASDSMVTWAVQPSDGGSQDPGSIDASGNYVAPAAPPSPVSVRVTAVLQSDPTVSGTASVSIQSSLAISPTRASLTLSQSLQLQVVSAGVSASDVRWAADGGTISQTGSYSPPGAAGTYTVTARLNANPSVAGDATVYVTDFAGTLTWRNDNQRSGVNSHELALSPATLKIPGSFGKLFSCQVDGYVYAQPLYVANLPIPGSGTHNVVFVATENDSVYAFDADANSCQQLWLTPTSLVPTGWQAVLSSNLYIPPPTGPVIVPYIVPRVGVTGTPVIDPSTSTLYAIGAAQEIATGSNYAQRLYGLDLATGQPRTLGTAISTPLGRDNFIATLENQRSALLLDGGKVYAAFGSYGVPGDYFGWLLAYDANSLQLIDAFSVTTDPGGGGIWQSGGGPSADSSHNIFVVTGDGIFDVERGGSSYSNSFLRFGPSNGLSNPEYFTPCNQGAGQDVGASAPVLLPDSAGSSAQQHLLIGGSKGGSLYVVNRDPNFMGGYSPSPCPDSPPRAQTVSIGGPILSTPVYWNNAVYVAPGNNGHLMSFQLEQGTLSPSPATMQSQETLGPQGATPVVSWNAASNDASTAVLWLIDTSGALAASNGPAILRAYDPRNLSELYESATEPNKPDTAGLAVKFTVPTVANGKVYVGTQGELDVYGLLP